MHPPTSDFSSWSYGKTRSNCRDISPACCEGSYLAFSMFPVDNLKLVELCNLIYGSLALKLIIGFIFFLCSQGFRQNNLQVMTSDITIKVWDSLSTIIVLKNLSLLNNKNIILCDTLPSFLTESRIIGVQEPLTPSPRWSGTRASPSSTKEWTLKLSKVY